jgi:hypothetical protein
VGNILRRHGIPPPPKRSQNTNWKDFIAAHMAVLAGVDFFTVEVLTWRGRATYYVLFFLDLETRRVSLAGITRHPQRRGWSRWLEARSTRPPVIYANIGMYRMIETRVLRLVPSNAGNRKRELHCVTTAQSECERLRRTQGTIGQAGMPLD